MSNLIPRLRPRERNVSRDLNVYGVLRANQILPIPPNTSVSIPNLVFPDVGIENIITVGQSLNADFQNIPDALLKAKERLLEGYGKVLIKFSPGFYYINDTLSWPANVNCSSDNSEVIIIMTDPNKNIIEFEAGDAVLDRIILTGATNGAGFVKNTSGNGSLMFCQVVNCKYGIICDGATSYMRVATSGTLGNMDTFLTVRNNGLVNTTVLAIYNVLTAIRLESGGQAHSFNVTIEDTTTGMSVNDGTLYINACQCFNTTNALTVETNGRVEGAELNCFGCTNDLNTSNDIDYCRIGNCRLDETKLNIADESLVSLNITDSAGRDKYYGGATSFEIQQINIFGASAVGTRPPQLSLFQDDGNNSPVGHSVEFTNTSIERVSIPSNPNLNFHSGDYTVEFWFNAQSGGSSTYNWYLSRQSSIDIYHYKPNNSMYVSLSGLGSLSLLNIIMLNNRYHFILTYDSVAKEAIAYIDGVEITRNTFTGTPTNISTPTFIGNRFATNLFYQTKGVVDEMNFWSKTFTLADVATSWNNGNGISNTNTTDLMAGYHFDEGSGTTAFDYGVNGINGTLDAGITYVDGLINATTSATTGVIAYSFDSDIDNELFFNVHPDAGYKNNEPIIPVIHWSVNDTTVGDVVWSMELTTAIPNSTFPITTVLSTTTSTTGTAKEHLITELPSFTVPVYNSIIMARLFRNGINVADTYPEDAFLLSVSFKYVKNKLGSDT